MEFRQTDPLQERKISLATMNVSPSTLRFFYKATLGRQWAMEQLRYPRRAKKLPVVLSKNEVFRLFAAIRYPKHRTALMTLYATGMRVFARRRPMALLPGSSGQVSYCTHRLGLTIRATARSRRIQVQPAKMAAAA